jgi:predicted lipoprotein with Yx(FWY)xxD motif
MTRSLSTLVIPAVALAVAVPAVASAQSNPPTPATSASVATVRLDTTKLGKVLADGSGRTLYLFEKDKGPKSNCFSTCASAWPPVTTTGTPKAGPGISASKLGTISRGHGVKQVTYNHHPLYRFVKDTRARQTNGEGVKAFGAEWYVLNASGRKVEGADS